ncbi:MULTISPECIES: plasmid replication initiator RepA [unclassified Pseudoalteromonas]|uniref:plasmid replication initiator RepA n=1 Tax=unclassified Pseudoalteromonas TaxID=194690 RepID=UPI001023B24B|nr:MULTISPECIES: plasmid replication initiator RepA [unclassified Pseudoalteromonas]MCF2829598.1 hypothetical protein [Pseudoalteromonas sp. OF5H-5]MCF2830854.1 hypothetical protein [Pseudoalteromonas sp. DL2-H6]MCF2927318.1 hypothetical protein [Pseudoalteromonas sp. DL2-H1]RZG17393.1 hypothetical protein EXT47_02760 [Pseudoalteromonas sp. CO342X]
MSRENLFGTQDNKLESKRGRGLHSTRCKNKAPSYDVPKSHVNRLVFIKRLVDQSQARDVTRSDVAMLARSWNGRRKHFYQDRVNAINALHAVFCEHVNLATHQIEISLRNASDAAGLTTISDAELRKIKEDPSYTPKVSISRASRALKDMVDMNWIKADRAWQVWDNESGQWIDKYFEATTLFFNAAGVTNETVEKEQAKRLGRYKHDALLAGKTPEEVGRMSITKLRIERRQMWRRKAFERRQLEVSKKKITRQLTGKSRHEQRSIAQQRVLASLGPETQFITPSDFKELVNREIAMLRKFSGVIAPPH